MTLFRDFPFSEVTKGVMIFPDGFSTLTLDDFDTVASYVNNEDILNGTRI